MNHRQVIFRFLFPSDQDAAKAIHPAMGSLHHPTTRLEAGLSFDRLRFLTACLDVGRITELLDQIAHRVIVITFVQAHPLRMASAGLGAFDRNTLQRRLDQLAVMPIGAVNRQANRYAAGFRQQTAINAFFGPIRGIGAGFFPRPAGLLSSRRPSTATTSRCLLIYRNLPKPIPTASKTPRPGSILETASGPCCWNTSPFRLTRSIGNRFAGRKRFRPWPDGPAPGADRRRNDGCSYALAAMALFFAIICPKSCTDSSFFASSSLNPFKSILAFVCIGYSGVIRIGSKYDV